jgi:nitroreductase
MIKELVLKNRSYRRFYEDHPIEIDTLRALVDLARLSPSAANLQPLKYLLSNDPHKNSLIFPHLAWAGYLKDWPGPMEGERPSAYIISLVTVKSTQASAAITGFVLRPFCWARRN